MVLIPKNHLFRVFFVVFSGTAHELMVPAEQPNIHLRTHVMQKEPIVLLSLPRRGTISGVQNVTLYSKNTYSNSIVPMDIQMVTGERAIQNT